MALVIMTKTSKLKPKATPLGQARAKAGITIEALAKKTGVPYSTIRMAETGKRKPKAGAANAIAKALGAKPEAIFPHLRLKP